MSNLNDKNVGILCGGWSDEREVSLDSGKTAYKSLKGNNINAFLFDYKKDDIDIYRLIQNISTYISNRISDRSKINIDFKTAESKYILGDETLLSWAFENLIKNSVDAIERGDGNILIELISISNKQIQIDIIDSGRGILRKDRVNVFKPGFSSKKRGWGLGLSLTKRIIEELHQGKIYVLRSQPGETVIRTILNLK